MKKIIIFLLVFSSIYCNAQKEGKAKYFESIKEAMKLYDLKKYKESADKYEEGFKAIEGKVFPNDRYNASCSYSLSNNSKRAFYHLFRLANDSKYSNLMHLKSDKDLENLHNSEKWNELIIIVKKNKEEKEKDLDKKLVSKLDTIFTNDQKYRRQYGDVLAKYGAESEEVKNLIALNKKSDSLNLIEVRKILDTKGWLGSNVIGGRGNATLFLVIQHSDVDTQLKYLPMMKEAVKKGNAKASSLALLEDRIALRQGKKQIYGSQIYTDKKTGEKYVAPLIDPKNVDKRRSEVGLPNLSSYTSRFGFTWDVDKHIKRTSKK